MGYWKLSETTVKVARYLQNRVRMGRNSGTTYTDFRMAVLGKFDTAIGLNLHLVGRQESREILNNNAEYLAAELSRECGYSSKPLSFFNDAVHPEFTKVEGQWNFFGVQCNTILMGTTTEPGVLNVKGLLPSALGPISRLLSLGLDSPIVGSYQLYEGKPLVGDIEYFDLFADVENGLLCAGIKGVSADNLWIEAAAAELARTISIITGKEFVRIDPAGTVELVLAARPYDIRFAINP